MMIKILDETKGDLVAIKVTEKLTKKDYEIFNPVMEKTLKDYKNPKIYCEVEALDTPTPQAMWEELKNIPDYNKFEKCAIVASGDWIENMAKVADTTMKPEVKAFELTEKGEALRWLQ